MLNLFKFINDRLIFYLLIFYDLLIDMFVSHPPDTRGRAVHGQMGVPQGSQAKWAQIFFHQRAGG